MLPIRAALIKSTENDTKCERGENALALGVKSIKIACSAELNTRSLCGLLTPANSHTHNDRFDGVSWARPTHRRQCLNLMLIRRPFVCSHSIRKLHPTEWKRRNTENFVSFDAIQHKETCAHQKNQIRWQFVLVFGCCMCDVGVGATGGIKYSSNFELSKCETMLRIVTFWVWIEFFCILLLIRIFGSGFDSQTRAPTPSRTNRAAFFACFCHNRFFFFTFMYFNHSYLILSRRLSFCHLIRWLEYNTHSRRRWLRPATAAIKTMNKHLFYGFSFSCCLCSHMCACEYIWTVTSRLCRGSDSLRWPHKDNGKFLAASADPYSDSGRKVVISGILGVVQMKIQ